MSPCSHTHHSSHDSVSPQTMSWYHPWGYSCGSCIPPHTTPRRIREAPRVSRAHRSRLPILREGHHIIHILCRTWIRLRGESPLSRAWRLDTRYMDMEIILHPHCSCIRSTHLCVRMVESALISTLLDEIYHHIPHWIPPRGRCAYPLQYTPPDGEYTRTHPLCRGWVCGTRMEEIIILQSLPPVLHPPSLRWRFFLYILLHLRVSLATR